MIDKTVAVTDIYKKIESILEEIKSVQTTRTKTAIEICINENLLDFLKKRNLKILFQVCKSTYLCKCIGQWPR